MNVLHLSGLGGQGRGIVAVGFLLLFGCSVIAQEKLVITGEDFLRPVGAYDIYTATSPDGERLAELKGVVQQRLQFGTTNIMIVQAAGSNQNATWVVVTPDRLAYYGGPDGSVLQRVYPLPLEAGKTYTYKIGDITSALQVTGEESLTVPAGTFRCLVGTVTENDIPSMKFWIAPGAGHIQLKGVKPRPFTLVLKESKNSPPVSSPPAGSDMLVNFELGGTKLCPKPSWDSYHAKPGEGMVAAAIDSTVADRETSNSLRLSYHLNENPWLQTNVMLGGSWSKPVDLSGYDSISFSIKGWKPGNGGIMLQCTKEYAGMPIKYTTDWTRVTIPLDDECFDKIDMHQLLLIGFVNMKADETGEGNVVWIDEITTHRKASQ